MPVSDLQDPAFWIPTIISIVTVVLFYADMRYRLKQGEKAPKEMIEMISLMRQELDLFRKQAQEGRLTSQEIERQKLLQKQDELQWRKTVDRFKGFAALAKIAKQFDDDE